MEGRSPAVSEFNGHSTTCGQGPLNRAQLFGFTGSASLPEPPFSPAAARVRCGWRFARRGACRRCSFTQATKLLNFTGVELHKHFKLTTTLRWRELTSRLVASK